MDQQIPLFPALTSFPLKQVTQVIQIAIKHLCKSLHFHTRVYDVTDQAAAQAEDGWAALNHQTSFLMSHPVCCDNTNHRDQPATGCTSLQGIKKQSMYPQVCRLQMMNTLYKKNQSLAVCYTRLKNIMFAAVNFRPACYHFFFYIDFRYEKYQHNVWNFNYFPPKLF